jgi:hypothetical protein
VTSRSEKGALCCALPNASSLSASMYRLTLSSLMIAWANYGASLTFPPSVRAGREETALRVVYAVAGVESVGWVMNGLSKDSTTVFNSYVSIT